LISGELFGDATSYWVASYLTVRLNGMLFYCIEQLLTFGNVTSLLTVNRHFLHSSKYLCISSTKGFQRVAVKYVSVYETKEVVHNSRWEILASAEAIVCQTAVYC